MSKALENITIYVLGFFLLSFVLQIPSLFINIPSYYPIYQEITVLNNNIINISLYIGLLGILLLKNYDSIIFDFKSLTINKENNSLISTISFVFFGILSVFLVSYFVNYLFPSQTNNQTTLNALYSKKGLLIIHAVLLAPLVEEIVFRKSFNDLIKNKILFVLISGFIFGLFHCLSGDFHNIIKYMIPGFMFSILFLIGNKNTLKNYFVHALYNLIIILLV